MRTNGFGKAGDDLGIQPVGLCQPPCGFGVVADLPSIDDGNIEACFCKKIGDIPFEATCWLQNDQGRLKCAETAHKLPHTDAIVGNREAVIVGMKVNVEASSADIDPDKLGCLS